MSGSIPALSFPWSKSKPTPAKVEDLPPGRLLVSRRSLEAIVRFEIDSPAYYAKFLNRPTWPGGESGVTIGIGYDLGYCTRDEFRAAWGDQLPAAECRRLEAVIGLQGKAADLACDKVEDIRIGLLPAQAVFEQRTLGLEAKKTRETFPGVEALPPDAQGALLSLVYNRGTSMTKPSMDARAEMRAIRTIVRDCGWAKLENAKRAAVLKQIAGQLEAMTRLWKENPKSDGDLCDRRRAEARLMTDALRVYQVGELQVV